MIVQNVILDTYEKARKLAADAEYSSTDSERPREKSFPVGKYEDFVIDSANDHQSNEKGESYNWTYFIMYVV